MVIEDTKIIAGNIEDFIDLPDGINKLRKAILTLAISGELVPQDPKEGTGEDLYQKILEERMSDAKNNRGKMLKLPPIKGTEVPFEIPKSWKWVRLGEVSKIIGGGTPNSSMAKYYAEPGSDNSIPWITPADMRNNSSLYVSHGKKNITEGGLKSSSARILPVGSVIFSSRAPIGYVGIAFNPLTTNQGFKSCIPYSQNPEYLYWYLLLRGEDINRRASGMTFKEISGAKFSLEVFSMPPLAEQKRIAEKVKELMKIVDMLEMKKKMRDEVRSKLAISAFLSLGKSESTIALHNMTELIKDLNDVKELEKAILSLAVSGKLVPQDPKEGTGEELYQKILNEQTKFAFKTGKKINTILSIEETDFGYEIPKSWKRVRIGDVCAVNPRNDIENEKEVSFIPMQCIDSDWVNNPIEKEKRIWKNVKKNFTHIADGDAVLAKVTPCFENGKSGVAMNLTNGFAAGTTELHVFRPYNNTIDPKYLISIFKSALFVNKAVIKMTGVAGLQRVPTAFVSSFLIGLPPLKEQKRIVKRIDELMILTKKLRILIKID